MKKIAYFFLLCSIFAAGELGADILYETGFNTTDGPPPSGPFVAGDLNGQHGWTATGTVNAQAATVYEGDQAVQIKG